MNRNYIIAILLIVLLVGIYYVNNKAEHLTSTSNEAVQNIASLYSDKNNIATLNNVKITGNLEVDTSFNMIPRGSIIAFNSQTAPSGWALCDGGTYKAPNGDSVTTPDLRGRFIRMSYTMTGANGGDVNGDNLPVNISDSAAIPLNVYSRDDTKNPYTKMQDHNFGEYGGTDWRVQSEKELAGHTHTSKLLATGYEMGWPFQLGCGGNCEFLQIQQTSGMTGSSYGFGVMPPYYVLTYIMKL